MKESNKLLPVCRKTPLGKYQSVMDHIGSKSKIGALILILTIGPIAGVIVLNELDHSVSKARITNNNHEDYDPYLLLDSTDHPHVFWASRTNNNVRLNHAAFSSPKGDGWKISACPTLLEDQPRQITGVVDKRNDIHLFYSYGHFLYYVVYYQNGSWSKPIKLISTNNELLDIHPILAPNSINITVLYTELEEIDKITEWYYKAFVNQAVLYNSQTFQLVNSIEIPDNIRYPDDFLGIKQINSQEIKAEYLRRVPDSNLKHIYTPSSLVNLYFDTNTFELLFNITLPLDINFSFDKYDGWFSDRCNFYAKSLPSDEIGIIALEPNNHSNWLEDEEGSRLTWGGFLNLTLYGGNASDWQKLIITDEVRMNLHRNIQMSSVVQITEKEFVFVMQQAMYETMLAEWHEGTLYATFGLYFVHFIKQGSNMVIKSHGWLYKEKNKDNERPFLAVDSQGRLHITWIQDESENPEFFYDFEGSGWDLVDWSSLDRN